MVRPVMHVHRQLEMLNAFVLVERDSALDDRYAYFLFKLTDQRTRPTRVMTVSRPLAGVKIGTEFELWDTDGGTYIGPYKVVGVKDRLIAEEAGETPDRKLAHVVYDVI